MKRRQAFGGHSVCGGDGSPGGIGPTHRRHGLPIQVADEPDPPADSPFGKRRRIRRGSEQRTNGRVEITVYHAGRWVMVLSDEMVMRGSVELNLGPLPTYDPRLNIAYYTPYLFKK